MAGLVFASVIFQGQDREPAELAVRKRYVREQTAPITVLVPVPSVTAREQTAPITVLVPVPSVTARVTKFNCGATAFESALASTYGPDSVGGVACIDFFGIGTVKSSGPEAPGGIGFFRVGDSGLWRLVYMIESDGDVAASLPVGFPYDLLRIWSGI